MAATRVRPSSKQGGQPITVDLACLTSSQRDLWRRTFPHLEAWTEGTRCQATRLELVQFSEICLLDDVPPRWSPEIAAILYQYARMLEQYKANIRAARERGEL
jgi:hypothetical protein